MADRNFKINHLIYASVGLFLIIIIFLTKLWLNNRLDNNLTIVNKTGGLVNSSKIFVCDKPINTVGWNGRYPLRIRFKCGYDTEFYIFIDFGRNRRVSDHIGYVASGIRYSDIIEIYENKIQMTEHIVN